MKLYTIFIINFVLTFNSLYCQQYELGKVTIDELKEKQHFIDTSATAAILFQSGIVKYPTEQKKYFKTNTTVKTKIKIYKKEGLENANYIINYYSGQNSGVRIEFSKAITYNLINNKIEKTELKDEGQFKTTINKFWTQKTITMPNVRVGSIIEFEYEVIENGVGTPTNWYFQKNIPINYTEFTTIIPEFFIYKKNQKGYIFPKTKSINLLDKAEYRETKTSYIAENMPAIKDEIFVNNIQNYTSSISHELTAINIPGRYYNDIAQGWESITKNIYKIDDFNNELNKKNYFEEELKKVLDQTTNRDEIILKTLNFVKSKVKWNNISSFLCYDGVKNAYKNGVGNSAEINLMLVAMLRYSNLEVNPVLISTRSNGLVFFPSIAAFNDVICAVEIEDDVILLDATEKFSTLNILPFKDLNYKGRLFRKDGNSSVEIDLTPKFTSRNINNINYTIKKEGKIEGKIRNQLTDYFALEYRGKKLYSNQDNHIEKLEEKYGSIDIGDFICENDFESDKPIVELFSFNDTKSIEILNDKILVAPLLFLTEKENPFKQEKREYPIDFKYPKEFKYNINIEIPEEYTIESLPQPISLSTEEGLATFKYFISTKDNKIQISAITNLKVSLIPADYYETLKDFYKQMIDKQNEKIVLKKI